LVNNRRSEIKIISEILHLSSQGAKKTELLYQGNFSYSQLQSYLKYLIEKKIIEENKVEKSGTSVKYYKTTQKGLSLLQDVDKVIEQLKL